MTSAAHYRSIGELPQELPVFPLRGCILLPRAVLPLRVFEPRYLAMLDDVIRGARMIGIVQPDPDAGPLESPPGQAVGLRRVGCAGLVTAFDELADGRLVIRLTGICRYEACDETTHGTPYRTFRVRYDRFAGDLVPESAATFDRRSLQGMLADYMDAYHSEADWHDLAAATPETLVNALAIASPFAPEERQALLEANDVKARAETLAALAHMERAGGRRGAASRLQ